MNAEPAVSGLAGLLRAEYLSGDEHLTLTETGLIVSSWLTNAFGDLTSLHCAAGLHSEISSIASGETERLDVLRAFWLRFGEALRPTTTPSVTSESAFTHKPIVLRPVEGG